MRLLLPGPTAIAPLTELDHDGLAEVYRPPSERWLRANMVSSLDGAATGSDGRSGSINTEADHVVFELLRAQSHAVVVGAGTVRAEGYDGLAVDDRLRRLRDSEGLPALLPLVVVGNSGTLPDSVRDQPSGTVLLAAPRHASGLADARDALGDEHVLVHGDDELDLAALVADLHDRGLTRLLTEGGPSLLGSLLAAGLLDELCLTWSPSIVGGDPRRPVTGDPLDVDLALQTLVEQDSTLMGRWFVQH